MGGYQGKVDSSHYMLADHSHFLLQEKTPTSLMLDKKGYNHSGNSSFVYMTQVDSTFNMMYNNF